MTRDIAQNLLREEQIPIARMNEEKIEKLKVIVDGVEGDIFIQERYGSDKIVIIFKQQHPRFGEFFTTKYFFFEEPGIMGWGHNNEKMNIILFD